jgi:hypothetical protein
MIKLIKWIVYAILIIVLCKIIVAGLVIGMSLIALIIKALPIIACIVIVWLIFNGYKNLL